MIPTVENILRMLKAGECSHEQALGWMTQHLADSARLDFIAEHPRVIQHATGYHGGEDTWTWMGADLVINEADNLRAAIDAAMHARAQVQP